MFHPFHFNRLRMNTMNTPVFRIGSLAVLVLLLITGAVQRQAGAATEAKKAPAAPVQFWDTRCDTPKDKKAAKYCEAFQRLSIQSKDKKDQLRLIELAIGFPPDKKGEARGVLIVPLGV